MRAVHPSCWSLSSSSFQMEVVCAKAAAHQGLNSLKRFTNLLSGFNVINFELNGFDASKILIQYGSLGIPQTPKKL